MDAQTASRPAPIPRHGPGGRPAQRTHRLVTGFFTQDELAELLYRRLARPVGRRQVEHAGRRFALHEAVRVAGRRDGGRDALGLTGRVERIEDLVLAGAELGVGSVRLAGVEYVTQRGVIAVAIGDGDEPPAPAGCAM
ncbi:MAG: hypothetical protein HY744_15920 [Deltaproteobacteria bacterium]|nr:hypothetical protein [Deltaproteobacteria bacterium]